jgi:hypothetical protein
VDGRAPHRASWPSLDTSFSSLPSGKTRTGFAHARGDLCVRSSEDCGRAEQQRDEGTGERCEDRDSGAEARARGELELQVHLELLPLLVRWQPGGRRRLSDLAVRVDVRSSDLEQPEVGGARTASANTRGEEGAEEGAVDEHVFARGTGCALVVLAQEVRVLRQDGVVRDDRVPQRSCREDRGPDDRALHRSNATPIPIRLSARIFHLCRGRVVKLGMERGDDDHAHQRNRGGGHACGDVNAGLGSQAFERAPHLRSEEDGRPECPQRRLGGDQEQPHPELPRMHEGVPFLLSVGKPVLLPRQTGQAEDAEADRRADERDRDQRRRLEVLPRQPLRHRDRRHLLGRSGIAPSAASVNVCADGAFGQA